MKTEHTVTIFPKYSITLYDDDPRLGFTHWEELYQYELTGRYKITNGHLSLEVETPKRYRLTHWEWLKDGYIIPRRIAELVESTEKLWIPEDQWVVQDETIYTCGEDDE